MHQETQGNTHEDTQEDTAAMAKGEVAAPVAGLTLQRAAEYDEGIFDVTNRLQSMVPSL
jgi:hypothetical protein